MGQWRSTLLETLNDMKAAELMRLNQIEREAWAEFERSKMESIRTVEDAENGKVSTTRETQCGNPRYLGIVQECIKQRCEILGLDAPTKLEHSGRDGGPLAVETKIKHYVGVFEKFPDEGFPINEQECLRQGE